MNYFLNYLSAANSNQRTESIELNRELATPVVSMMSQKGFSTGDLFNTLHGKNVWHKANVRGLIHQRYNELLMMKLPGADQIPGGNDPEKLGLDKSTLIIRPDLYHQAYRDVLLRFNDGSDFPFSISTGMFFDLLHNENVRHSANVRGLINQRYNQLLEANKCWGFLIQENNLENLGLNKTTPIQRADLYFQAYGDILRSFEINNLVIYSFDVGGTKIAYSISDKNKTFAKGEISTSKGLSALIKSVESVFTSNTVPRCERAISIATPGLIKNGVMESANLLEALNDRGEMKHEFHNLHFKNALSKVIPNTKIFHSNDGIAQFKGAVDLLNTEGCLNGKTVAYLGIGSGFGGGLGRIDSSGKLHLHTDGEVWDIRLKLDGHDTFACTYLGGFPFKEATGSTPKEVNESPELLSKHTCHIKKLGRTLAATAITIHHGNVKKMDSRNDWSENELNQIRGTSHFLIGGSIGTKGPISTMILESAREEISNAGLGKAITFMQIPDSSNAALKGCQSFMEEAFRANVL